MKIFWSWQADTPGKIGRHFVRAALADAVKTLKQPEDLEEPSERDVREALHLDHDRQGVPGSPDLAPTIFGKIDRAAVFIADVTLVATRAMAASLGAQDRQKKLINSNVAIEFGYALRCLGDGSILMIQNGHYGDRDELPFDLRHKAGPIQYRLAPGATRAEIASEHARLRGALVAALTPYIERAAAPAAALPRFEETPSTTNIAFFWGPSEVLAALESILSRVLHRPADDAKIEYRFNEQHIFYLRLIPTAPRPELQTAKLMDIVTRRCVYVLTPNLTGARPGRNRFGAIAYEPHGDSAEPTAFTQIFRNGEIWGVTRAFAAPYDGALVVPMVALEGIVGKALANFLQVAGEEMGVVPPYQIELGAVGLRDMCVSLPQTVGQHRNQVSEPIYDDQLRLRRILNGTGAASQRALIEEFLVKLYDLAAVRTG